MAHLRTEGEETYMLIANPDVVPESDCLARMAEAMDAHPEAGSVGPKLLKMRVAASEDSFNGDARDTDRMSADELVREGKRTTVLDSAGLRMYRSRRIVDRGAGEEDGHYDRPEEVFGVSAALALYRLSALEDAAYRGQYFDDQFFAYKEDIDLAWRLRLLGWKAFYVPSGRAYHYRTAAGADSMSLRVLHGVRRDRSEFVKYLSYRNHLFLLAKNDHAINMIRYAARMGCYEFGKLVYACCFEPRTVRALPAFLRGLPAVLAKRRDVMRRARVKAGDIRTWLA
jgi:GT2 family glycosyltransferase